MSHTQGAADGDAARTTDLRRSIFEHVRREYVPLDVLSRYARALHPDFTALWLFRRQFTVQLAATALATYVLGLIKCAPHSLRIVGASGSIVPWDLAFSLDGAGLLVPSDRVPFRLTPTLVNLASPAGVSGIFSGSLVAGAQALGDPDMPLADHVGVILRDEILSWVAAGGRGVDEPALALKIRQNTDSIARRLGGVGATGDGALSVETLIKNATATGNLCLMSPMWHPWL